MRMTWKLSPTDREAVVSRYAAGERVADLAAEYGIHITAIYGLLRRRGLAARGNKAMSPEAAAQAVEAYLSGESSCTVAGKFGVSRPTICREVRRSGSRVRNGGETRRKWLLNEGAFDEITPEAAYWIGFLIADGCVYKPTTQQCSWRLSLALKSTDRPHVEAFASFLGTNKPLQVAHYGQGIGGDGKSVSLCVSSDKLAAQLAEFGIKERKTQAVRPPEAFLDDCDFWRGVVDGDGSLCWLRQKNRSYPYLCLAGSLAVCEAFAAFAGKHTGKPHRVSRGHGRSWAVKLFNKDAVAVANAIYNGNIALPRKAEMAKRFSDFSTSRTVTNAAV